MKKKYRFSSLISSKVSKFRSSIGLKTTEELTQSTTNRNISKLCKILYRMFLCQFSSTAYSTDLHHPNSKNLVPQ